LHYHAVRVLGASAYRAEQIIASRRSAGRPSATRRTSCAACMRPRNAARGIKHPRIWTASRDVEMWKAIA
jgi:hypothetical protein